MRELGKRHRDYKVTRTDYDRVERALLWTLEEFLADDFTALNSKVGRIIFFTGEALADMVFMVTSIMKK